MTLTEVGSSVAKLKRWQLDFTSEFPSRYRIVSMNSFDHVRTLSREHFNTFTTAYSFLNIACERDYQFSILCLLKLQRVALGIYGAFGKLWKGTESETQLQLQVRTAKADAAVCADGLCMVVPWLTLPQNTVYGGIYALHLLQDAAEYYHECVQGKQKQLAWCRQISMSLKRLHGIDVCF